MSADTRPRVRWLEERKSSGEAFSDDRRRFVKLRASVNAALQLLKTKLVYPVPFLSPPLWRAFIMVIAWAD